MKHIYTIILFTFCSSLSANEAFLEADAKCMAAKNHHLKEARKEKIAICKKQKEFAGQLNTCEQFYADYGNPLFDPKGFQIKKGLFDDIPECLKALELQNTTNRY